jgi:hypothetical protein
MTMKTAAMQSPVSTKKKSSATSSSVSTKRKTVTTLFAVKRRHLRFQPDPLEYAQIAVRSFSDPFTPELVALVAEEAPMGGCGLVLLETPLLKVGDLCRVKVGRIDPLRAQVAWRQVVEPGIIRLGLKFLE